MKDEATASQPSRAPGETRAGLPSRRSAPVEFPLRGRLLRKYVTLFAVVVSATLLIGGFLQIWFAYAAQTDSLTRLHREQTLAAAAKIGQFVHEIESQIGWTTHLPRNSANVEQLRFDAQRLLRQVPAITEVAMLDADGREQLRVSRLSIDVIGSARDLSDDPAYIGTFTGKTYHGPVYLRRGSEPYMSIAVSGNRRSAGVTVAEVNLKFIWDVVSQIRVGESGSAYVVDATGRLVAHPDIGLVLKATDLSGLAQVRNAPGMSDEEPVRIATDVDGRQVLSARATVAPLGWNVFVELPLREAFRPVYAAVTRSVALLAGGLLLASWAGLLLARRMVEPIQALREGAVRIGQGELGHTIAVRTGDELEDLAEQFTRMAERLRHLYGNLERISQLKRYFSPHLAELIVSSEDNILGRSHRRDITVLFCDLRGFTSFSSSADPEIVMQVLADYYSRLGLELRRHEATIGHFAGDGLMAFLNDPLLCPDHQTKAIRMSLAMLEAVATLTAGWRGRGYDLGFGIGIASRFATLGDIGSEDQFHYTAIGPVVNLASRLCDEAADGQILLDASLLQAGAKLADPAPVNTRALKGFSEPISVYSLSAPVTGARPRGDAGAARPIKARSPGRG